MLDSILGFLQVKTFLDDYSDYLFPIKKIGNINFWDKVKIFYCHKGFKQNLESSASKMDKVKIIKFDNFILLNNLYISFDYHGISDSLSHYLSSSIFNNNKSQLSIIYQKELSKPYPIIKYSSLQELENLKNYKKYIIKRRLLCKYVFKNSIIYKLPLKYWILFNGFFIWRNLENNSISMIQSFQNTSHINFDEEKYYCLSSYETLPFSDQGLDKAFSNIAIMNLEYCYKDKPYYQNLIDFVRRNT